MTLPQGAAGWPKRAGRTYPSPFQVSPQGKPYLLLAVPAADGRVVAAQISLEPLWERVRTTSLGRSGVVYLADQNGRILAHPDPEQVLRGAGSAARSAGRASGCLASLSTWNGAGCGGAVGGTHGATHPR